MPGTPATVVLFFAAIAVSGCGGGQRVLNEPAVAPTEIVLSSASDDQLGVGLHWVIIRNGAGSWSSNADWDQYVMGFSNLSDEPVRIIRVNVVDSLEARIRPRITREQLAKGSRGAVQRYSDAGIEVHAGMAGDGVLATGTAMALAGNYLAAYSTIGLLAGTVSGLVFSPIPAYMALFALPVTGVYTNDAQEDTVNDEIIRRQTVLPFRLAANGRTTASFFYPISPSPTKIEVTYVHESGARTLVVDIHGALHGLHLESLPETTAQDLRSFASPE